MADIIYSGGATDTQVVLDTDNGPERGIKTFSVSGDLLYDGGATDTKVVVQTDNGPEAAEKVYNLNGGGGGAGLPDQTGHSGEFLTTDGTEASWAAVSGGITPTVDTYTGNTGTTLATGETLSDFDTILIYKNGVLLTEGVSADYTISTNSIVFATALQATDIVTLIGLGGFAPTSTVVWGNVTGTLSNQTDLQTALNGKQSATTVTTLTTASTELATNTIYNGGELASVTITLPATVPTDFVCQLEFSSGAVATSFTAPATLYFNGDACDGGVFTPVANKRYCIMIISDGVNTLGFCYER